MPSADIPNEVIFDILLRVSAKDLIRFKCVSTYWCALVNDSYFKKKHLKRRSIEDNNTNVNLILKQHCYCSGLLREVDLDNVLDEYNTTKVDYGCPFKTHHVTRIVGSCNGLVCLSTEENRVVIWNPSTRKFHELPTTTGSVIYGFGHDCNSDDYKVIGLHIYMGIISVYSLQTKTWTRTSNYIPYRFNPVGKSWVFASTGNAIHCVCIKNQGRNDWINPRYLIGAIDLEDNEYREVQQPDYKFEDDLLTLGVLKGCLCVFSCCSNSSDLWVMKEYGVKVSWTRLISITVTTLAAPGLKKRPLAYSMCGEKVLVHDCSNCKLIWYDLKTKTATNVELRDDSVDICLGEVYVQSLVFNGHGLHRRIVTGNELKCARK